MLLEHTRIPGIVGPKLRDCCGGNVVGRSTVRSVPVPPRVRAIPWVVLEDEVIAQIAESLPELTPNRGSIDSGERGIAVRSSRNGESGRGRMGGAPPRSRLAERQRHGDRGEELPTSEHQRLPGYGSPRQASREIRLRNPADIQQARRLFERHRRASGLRWWSPYEASWMNVTLFDRARSALRVSSVRALTVDDTDVTEAADFFALRA
jgi:hypothetical protein